MEALEFPSKVDAWLIAVIAGAAVLCLVGALVSMKKKPLSAVVAAAVGIAMLVATLAVAKLSYTLSPDGQVTVDWLLRDSHLFDANTVEAITPTRNSRSSPAASLDRLEVRWRSGPHERWVLVSPEDKGGFVAAVCAFRPELKCDGATARLP